MNILEDFNLFYDQMQCNLKLTICNAYKQLILQWIITLNYTCVIHLTEAFVLIAR